jgi:diacylglycerol kinase family enzyme
VRLRRQAAVLAWTGIKIAFGMVDSTRDLETYRTSSPQITSHRHALLVSLDGEAVSMDMPLNFQIRPAALQVLAPAETTRTGGRAEGGQLQ